VEARTRELAKSLEDLRTAQDRLSPSVAPMPLCCIAAFPASCGAFNSHVDFGADGNITVYSGKVDLDAR
jgi:hypothetical protein